MALSTEMMLRFYTNMYKTRKFEEEMFEYYKTGAMPGLVHTSVGQEAVGTGAVAALRPEDFVAVHHRSHAHFFMRGCEPKKVLAEILGALRQRLRMTEDRSDRFDRSAFHADKILNDRDRIRA